jgi:hypothetical protein
MVSVSSQCLGADAVHEYKGIIFTIADCHDWSVFRPLAIPLIPAWPLVNANILKHFHFDSGLDDSGVRPGLWHRFGYSINWSIQRDSTNGAAITYLATNCGGDCGPSGTQAVYQDIQVDSEIYASGCFLFGANVRTEEGSGSISFVFQILSNDMKVLWQDIVTDTVYSDNGDGRAGEADSVYHSVKFVGKVVAVPYINETSAFFRFLIIPNDLNTFFVIDTFVNKFPCSTSSTYTVEDA